MDSRGQGPTSGQNAFLQPGMPAGPNMPPVPAWGADPNRTKRMAFYGVLTGIAVILALFLGLKAAGVFQLRSPSATKGTLQATGESPGGVLLQARGENPGALLKAQGDRPTGLLEAHGTPPDPILRSESKAPVDTPMPDDVREWLDHLRRTEEKRISLATSQISEAMVLMMELKGAGASMEQLQGLLDEAGGIENSADTKSTVDTALAKARAMQEEWPVLIQFFVSKPPPAECVPVRDRYDQVLRETAGMINDIIKIVVDSDKDPAAAIAKLEAMKGKSKNMIDKPALAADDGVAAICRKYNTKKWFDIQGDTGSGLLKVGL
jgi:hypothetical protein